MDNLKTIYCDAKQPIVFDKPPFDNFEAILYVPSGSADLYRQAPVWRNFKNIIDFDFSEADIVTSDGIQVPTDYYNLEGLKVSTAAPGETPADLPAGTYIVRCGNKTEKVVIR